MGFNSGFKGLSRWERTHHCRLKLNKSNNVRLETTFVKICKSTRTGQCYFPKPLPVTTQRTAPKFLRHSVMSMSVSAIHTATFWLENIFGVIAAVIFKTLTFRYHASYIQDRRDVPLVPSVSFLYIQSTNIFNDLFLDFLAPSSFIPPQNVVYFIMLPFLVHKIFTFYINGVLKFKFPVPESKG